MSVEVPPAQEEDKDEDDQPEGSSRNPDVDELLRRLLVGELRLKVDPISGRAIPDGEPAPSEDHP